MNEYHSPSELNYKPRWASSVLREAITENSIVVLTGPRQVGKSTLLQWEHPFKDWKYFTMDDLEILAQSKKDPSALWTGARNIILDEVQKSTSLMNAVKIAVDTKPNHYKFILSGSANLNLMQKVSESLAGRAVYLTLYPMTTGEIHDLQPPKLLKSLLINDIPKEQTFQSAPPDPIYLMWKGFFPPLLERDSMTSILQWWEGYVMTYLERDLRQLSHIDSLPDFRRLMIALALRCGNMINQSEVSRDIGITQPTMHRYLNLLETTYLVHRLPAYSINRTKRLIKSPKILWTDPGLVAYLAGYFSPDDLKDSKHVGGIFEAMIYLHLCSLCQLMLPRPRLYYWRTTTGKEIDFVLEWGRKLLAIEVKLSKKPKYSDISTLKLFMEEYPETSAGILIYTGNEIKIMDERIYAIPWFLFGGAHS